MNTSSCFDNVSSLVVNDDVFDVVLSEIKTNEGSIIPQSVMIVGQEGSGKTTLLKRLYGSCGGRHCVWIDGRTVFSTDDIVQSNSLPKDSILFIDNIDYYFDRCSYDEQYRLRRFLYNEGAPTMIATVSKVLPAMSEYEAPFFEGLKIVYINPISIDVISDVFKGDFFDRALYMWKLLSPTIKSLNMICGIVTLNSVPEKDMEVLLSIFSDKYRNIYQSQPVYSQHILNALATKSSGMKIPEIRDFTILKTSTLTAYLKSLNKNAVISIDPAIKKSTVYAIRDPLFRLWLQRHS